MARKKATLSPYKFSIGQRVKTVLKEKGFTVIWLAEQLDCDRSNVYDLFNRDDMSTGILARISQLVGYDFFSDISKALDLKSSAKSKKKA